MGESESGEGQAPVEPSEQEALAHELAAQSTRDLEKLFRFVYGHRVRYDQVGAQGLLSPGGWMDLLQLARVEYFRNLGLFIEGGPAPVQMLVRRTTIEHLGTAEFDTPVVVRVRCSFLGERSARFEYLCDDKDGLRLAVAETVMVCVERDPYRSMSWPFTVRDRITEFEGAGLVQREG